MLGQRAVTAALLIAVLLATLFVPWRLFPVLILCLLGLSAWEWSSLARFGNQRERAFYVGGTVLLFLGVLWFQAEIIEFAFQISILVFLIWILFIPLLVRFPKTRPIFQNPVIVAAMGVVILLSTSSGLLWLEAQDPGPWPVLCLFAIVLLADSGAYFAGRRWGKHKLAPEISPDKTWEGVYGGLLANFLFALLLVFGLNMRPEQGFLVVFAVLLTSILSIEGDLLESAIKRSHGVKDSGTILPGHGGILDRIDGVTAATPCFIFCILYFPLE